MEQEDEQTEYIHEMAICEIKYLTLKLNKLYRFHAVEGCKQCEEEINKGAFADYE